MHRRIAYKLNVLHNFFLSTAVNRKIIRISSITDNLVNLFSFPFVFFIFFNFCYSDHLSLLLVVAILSSVILWYVLIFVQFSWNLQQCDTRRRSVSFEELGEAFRKLTFLPSILVTSLCLNSLLKLMSLKKDMLKIVEKLQKENYN